MRYNWNHKDKNTRHGVNTLERGDLMKTFKKFTTLAVAAALFCTSTSSLEAQACYTGGCGYQECRTCPSMTPAIALGAIALVAIIAVAVQNTSNKHGHCHL
jgi:hypothetical protein